MRADWVELLNAYGYLPVSSATFAPMHFNIPRGTMLNPTERAATSNSARFCGGVMSACANVFAKMMFSSQCWERVTASAGNNGHGTVIAGVSQWGVPYADLIAHSMNSQGMGGRAHAKGINAFGFPQCPFGRANNVEMLENEFPMLIPVSQHFRDGCGHGKHRGGVGTAQVWVAHGAPQISLTCSSYNTKLQTAQPLFGGYGPATVVGISVRGADILQRLREDPGGIQLDYQKILEDRTIQGDWQIEFMGRLVRSYNEGDLITFTLANGGGGYGDPLEAGPEGVVEDVVGGIISGWTALHIYKVAYHPETLKVNHAETERLRAAEREARLGRGHIWPDFQAAWSQLKPPEQILRWFGSWPDGKALAPVVRM